MGRRFKNTSAELHDWDARADKELANVKDMEDGPEREEARRKVDLLRIAADMKRVLTRLPS